MVKCGSLLGALPLPGTVELVEIQFGPRRLRDDLLRWRDFGMASELDGEAFDWGDRSRSTGIRNIGRFRRPTSLRARRPRSPNAVAT